MTAPRHALGPDGRTVEFFTIGSVADDQAAASGLANAGVFLIGSPPVYQAVIGGTRHTVKPGTIVYFDPEPHVVRDEWFHNNYRPGHPPEQGARLL